MESVEVLPWGEGNSGGSVAALASDGGELQQMITRGKATNNTRKSRYATMRRGSSWREMPLHTHRLRDTLFREAEGDRETSLH